MCAADEYELFSRQVKKGDYLLLYLKPGFQISWAAEPERRIFIEEPNGIYNGSKTLDGFFEGYSEDGSLNFRNRMDFLFNVGLDQLDSYQKP